MNISNLKRDLRKLGIKTYKKANETFVKKKDVIAALKVLAEKKRFETPEEASKDFGQFGISNTTGTYYFGHKGEDYVAVYLTDSPYWSWDDVVILHQEEDAEDWVLLEDTALRKEIETKQDGNMNDNVQESLRDNSDGY